MKKKRYKLLQSKIIASPSGETWSLLCLLCGSCSASDASEVKTTLWWSKFPDGITVLVKFQKPERSNTNKHGVSEFQSVFKSSTYMKNLPSINVCLQYFIHHCVRDRQAPCPSQYFSALAVNGLVTGQSWGASSNILAFWGKISQPYTPFFLSFNCFSPQDEDGNQIASTCSSTGHQTVDW